MAIAEHILVVEMAKASMPGGQIGSGDCACSVRNKLVGIGIIPIVHVIRLHKCNMCGFLRLRDPPIKFEQVPGSSCESNLAPSTLVCD